MIVATLKPCPFCGDAVYLTNEDCYGLTDDYFMVACDNCSLQFGFTKRFETPEKVAESWNKRIVPENEMEKSKCL